MAEFSIDEFLAQNKPQAAPQPEEFKIDDFLGQYKPPPAQPQTPILDAVGSTWDAAKSFASGVVEEGKDYAAGAHASLRGVAREAGNLADLADSVFAPRRVLARTVDEVLSVTVPGYQGSQVADAIKWASTARPNVEQAISEAIPPAQSWRPEMKGPVPNLPLNWQESIGKGTAGGVGVGLGLMKVVPAAANLFGAKFLHNMTKEIAANPKAWIGIEAGLGGASGASGELGYQMGGGEKGPNAELWRVGGEVLGGVGAAAGMGTIDAVRNTLRSKYGLLLNENLRMDVLQRELALYDKNPDVLLQEIEEAERLRKEFGGQPLPLGDITGNPGFVALQKLMGKANPGFAMDLIRRRQDARSVLYDAEVKARGLPKETADLVYPERIQQRVKEVHDGLFEAMETRMRNLDEQWDALVSGEKPKLTQEQASLVLKGELATAKAELDGIEKRNWAAVEAFGDLPMPTTRIRKWLDSVKGQYAANVDAKDSIPQDYVKDIETLFGQRNVPVQPADARAAQRQAREYMTASPPPTRWADPDVMPMSHIVKLHSRIQQDLRDTSAKAITDPKARSWLITLDDALMKTLGDKSSIPEEAFLNEMARVTYETARAFTVKRADLLSRGVSKEVRSVLTDGSFAVSPEALAANYIQKAKTGVGGHASRVEARQAADQLMELVGGSENARNAITEFLRGELRALVDTTGNLQPKHFEEFTRQYAGVLNHPEFAGLRGQFLRLGNARREIALKQEDAKQSLDSFSKSVAKLYLGESPETAATKIFHAPDGVERVRQLMPILEKDPLAVEGLRLGLLGKALDSLGQPVREFDEIIEARRALLKETGLQDEDITRMKELNAYRMKIGKDENIGTPAQTQTLLDMLPTVPTWLSRQLAIKRGQVSTTYAALDMITRPVVKVINSRADQAMRDIWMKFLVDPEFAKLALTQPARDPAAPRKFRNYMIGAGMISAKEIADAEEQERVQ